MKTVLLYGDSLSWGIIPGTRERLPFEQRWPRVMEAGLSEPIYLIEQCLNGRTTCFDEHIRPWRNGGESFDFVLHCHAPIELVIIALGANDLQSIVAKDAWASSQGVGVLIDKALGWNGEPAGSPPRVLLMAPPRITGPRGTMAEKFRGAESKSEEQIALYKQIAREKRCDYFASSTVVAPSDVDGVHLDAAAHQLLGEAMIPVVKRLLEDPRP